MICVDIRQFDLHQILHLKCSTQTIIQLAKAFERHVNLDCPIIISGFFFFLFFRGGFYFRYFHASLEACESYTSSKIYPLKGTCKAKVVWITEFLSFPMVYCTGYQGINLLFSTRRLKFCPEAKLLPNDTLYVQLRLLMLRTIYVYP